jgi:hypothetical protein
MATRTKSTKYCALVAHNMLCRNQCLSLSGRRHPLRRRQVQSEAFAAASSRLPATSPLPEVPDFVVLHGTLSLGMQLGAVHVPVVQAQLAMHVPVVPVPHVPAGGGRGGRRSTHFPQNAELRSHE